MERTSDQSARALESFIHQWSQFSQENPEIELGEWLKCFSIMTGLAMYMGDMPADMVEDAIDQMADIIISTYENADQHVTKGTVQ